MKTMFRLSKWNGEIEEKEVIRVTDQYVVTGSHRESRSSYSTSWHENKESALREARAIFQAKIDAAQAEIKRCNEVLGKLNNE
jgi:hypothetical protein